MSSPALEQSLATFGLASQLRSPTLDSLTEGAKFPSTFHEAGNPHGSAVLVDGSHAATNTPTANANSKVTPAMRDELKTSPRIQALAWTARDGPLSPSLRSQTISHLRNESYTSTRSMPISRDSDNLGSLGPTEVGDWSQYSLTARSVPSRAHHTRNLSLPNASRTPPARPARPSQAPDAKVLTADGLEFAPVPRLDLGVQMEAHDTEPYSTFKAAQTSPNLRHVTEADEEIFFDPQPESFNDHHDLSSILGNSTPRFSADPFSNDTKPLDEDVTPAVPSVEQSPVAPSSGLSTPARPERSPQMEVPVAPRRAHAPRSPQLATCAEVESVVQTNRLPVNLLSLAKRTGHLAHIPGYGWRLNLLEKYEEITGTFLSMQDAEDILSMGRTETRKSARRSQSRKSLIGMPPATSTSKRLKARAAETKGFLSKFKRVLGVPVSPVVEKAQAPTSPEKKVVFGMPLSIVAEYGFVTSMIAGQRHDLPGVCFATVEEIYRRGQGSNLPGLMQLAGEASRVAKLVQIYDTAPDYGESHDLSVESVHNVTSLLKQYLRDLPEPVLDQRLWRMYLSACVDSTKSLKVRVACAQIILRLLPTPSFSLLVYLVAFFSQMPLFPENRISLESVASIFGAATLAPRPVPASSSPKQGKSLHITGPTEKYEAIGASAKKAQDGLLWLLQQWSLVADGLLDQDFDIHVDSVLERETAPESGENHDEEEIVADTAGESQVYAVPAAAESKASVHTLEITRTPELDTVASFQGFQSTAPGPTTGTSTWSSRKAPGMKLAHVPAFGELQHEVDDDVPPPTPSKEGTSLRGLGLVSPTRQRRSYMPTASPTSSSESTTSSSPNSDSAPSSIGGVIDDEIKGGDTATQEVNDKEDVPVEREEILEPADEDQQPGSVLGDIMEFDTSSIYEFPTPPSAGQGPPSPIINREDELTAPGLENFDDAQEELQIGENKEDTPRSEETASEIDSLRAEHSTMLAKLRQEHALSMAHLQKEHKMALAAIDAMLEAAQQESRATKIELATVQAKRAREAEEASQRTAFLESQLDGIRSLLLGGARA